MRESDSAERVGKPAQSVVSRLGGTRPHVQRAARLARLDLPQVDQSVQVATLVLMRRVFEVSVAAVAPVEPTRGFLQHKEWIRLRSVRGGQEGESRRRLETVAILTNLK